MTFTNGIGSLDKVAKNKTNFLHSIPKPMKHFSVRENRQLNILECVPKVEDMLFSYFTLSAVDLAESFVVSNLIRKYSYIHVSNVSTPIERWY